MRIAKRWCGGVGLFLAAVTQSSSAALLTPSSISYVGTGVEFYADESRLIDGSGLSEAPTAANYITVTHANAVATNAWVTDDPTPSGGDYFAQNNGATLIFNLTFDQTYSFTDFVFWGYSTGQLNSNEVRQFKLEFSTDGGATYPASTTVENPLSTHAGTTSDTLSLGSTFTGNAVRLTFLDNHSGGTAPGGDRAGLGELRFIGAAIPEPGSIAVLGGVALVGLLKRRRA